MTCAQYFPNLETLNEKECKILSLIRAVFLRDLLDGDADLVAQVPPGIHHSVRAFSQDHLVSILIGLVDVLWIGKKNEWVHCECRFS